MEDDVKKEEPGKDSSSKRVNSDNEKKSKFDKKFKPRGKKGGGKASGFKPKHFMNDFTWYNKYPNLIVGAARIPFGNLVGQYNQEMKASTVPGIMKLRWAPTIGGTLTANGQFESTGINQAAESRYSFVVHANSRNESYDACDLQIVSLCGASIFALISLGERAYGTMRNYVATNKYLPQALIQESGFNFDDLLANYSHMWFDLNQRIARANQIWIPKDQPIINRWFWMNQAYYTDASSSKAQTYVFVMEKMYQYNERGVTNGPFAELVTTGMSTTNGQTWAAYLKLLDDSLTLLLESMDRGTMYGDTLKAYGAGNLFALNELPLDYVTSTIYEPEVLTQIENLYAINNGTNLSPSCYPDSVYQYEGLLYQTWESASSSYPPASLSRYTSPGATLLNFHKKAGEEITVEDVVIATRLKPGTHEYINLTTVDSQGTNTLKVVTQPTIVPTSCGTEVVTSISAAYYLYSSTSGTGSKSLVDVPITFIGEQNNYYQQMYAWCAFDWSPWLYNHATMVSTTDITPGFGKLTNAQLYGFEDLYGDWDEYTFISDASLSRIHLACEFSLWGMLSNSTGATKGR